MGIHDRAISSTTKLAPKAHFFASAPEDARRLYLLGRREQYENPARPAKPLRPLKNEKPVRSGVDM